MAGISKPDVSGSKVGTSVGANGGSLNPSFTPTPTNDNTSVTRINAVHAVGYRPAWMYFYGRNDIK